MDGQTDRWITQNVSNFLRIVILIVWPTNPSVPLRHFQEIHEVKTICEIVIISQITAFACLMLTFTLMLEKQWRVKLLMP